MTCFAYVHALRSRGTCGRPAKYIWTVPGTGERKGLCGLHVWRYADSGEQLEKCSDSSR